MTQRERLTRRKFLKIVGLSAAGAAAWQLGIRLQAAALAEVSVSRVLMGTVVNMTVVGEDEGAAKTAVCASLEQMSRLEAILSRHQVNSQLSQLNKNGILAFPSSHLIAVLQQAQAISARSGGAFDVTVKPLVDLYRVYQARNELPPETAVAAALSLVNHQKLIVSAAQVAFKQAGMAITVDGIGKGYIIDEGARVLREHSFDNVLVEAGGDLWASGKKDPGTGWQIGIRSPRAQGRLVAKFAAENIAVATSGDYMQPFTADYRLHHILDPRIGCSARELASATIMAPTATLADGLATAVMAMPVREAIALLEQTAGCEGYLVAKEGAVVRTSGFSTMQAG